MSAFLPSGRSGWGGHGIPGAELALRRPKVGCDSWETRVIVIWSAREKPCLGSGLPHTISRGLHDTSAEC